jgi:hypothetical protein
MCDPTYNNSNNNTREEDISAAITVIRIAAFFGRPLSVLYIFYYFLRVSVRDSHITKTTTTTTTTNTATITATATTLIAERRDSVRHR